MKNMHLSLLLVLTMGGFGVSAASASAPPDACAVVSKADAEKLAAKPLEDAGRGQNTCAYGPAKGGLPKVEVYVGDAATRYLTIEQNGGRKFRTLTGVAGEVFVSDAAGLLFVKKSNQLVAVRFVTLNDEKTYRKRFEDLAGVVASRM